MRAFLNRAARRSDDYRGLFTNEEYRDVHAYFAAHPELSPTPLRSLKSLAEAIGVGHVDAKDESSRFGLNAFKITGVRYAVHALGDAAVGRGVTCATAGNHGRAVARVARQKRLPCTIFLPSSTATNPAEARTRASRIEAMRGDGATVIEVDGTYEDAVRFAAAHGRDTGAIVVSDMSWQGYEEIPRRIMLGYTQLLEEAHAQWDAPPDLVVVQGGVGGLVCAAASWFAWRFGASRPFIVACEPEHAACLLASAEAGRPTNVDGPLTTIMAGLRCAEPSPVAWPAIANGIDAFVTIDDDSVLRMIDRLSHAPAEERIDAGPSGACGAAALGALLTEPEFDSVRLAAGLDRSTRALVIVTEGA